MFGSYWGEDFDEFGDGRPNRSSWSTKSQAAMRRQQEAIGLFDRFLKDCQTKTDFPITKEIVPAMTHLTDPCWQTFRRHVESKGCHAKRRIATEKERGKDQRKGKMYVVSVTVPVHPSKAVAVEEERKKQAEKESAKRREKAAALAARKKAEQERAEAKQRAELAARQERIRQEYMSLLASSTPAETEDRKPPAVTSSSLPMSVASISNGAKEIEERKPPPVTSSSLAMPVASISNDAQPAPCVSAVELLEYADKVHDDRIKEIRTSIAREETVLKQRLEDKKRQLEIRATADFKRAKTTILSSLPESFQCCVCKAPFKIAAAQCVSEDCSSKLCVTCAKKVDESHACVVCRRRAKEDKAAWIQNVKCPICVAKIKARGGYFNFDYCRNDCGFICPDHTKQLKCCVCGYSSFCTTCEIDTCDRCGDNLCSRCDIKEGCMCLERRRRRGWDDDLW